MVAGIGVMTFKLYDCQSLKGKRKVIKSIIAKIRNNFNSSVAETAYNDVYDKAQIGFTLAGNDRRVINSKIDKIFNFAEDLGTAQLIDTDMEIINL